jgi:hypothetical protein
MEQLKVFFIVIASGAKHCAATQKAGEFVSRLRNHYFLGRHALRARDDVF